MATRRISKDTTDKSLEYHMDMFTHIKEHRDVLSYVLKRLRDTLKSTYVLSPEGRKELDRIQSALDFKQP